MANKFENIPDGWEVKKLDIIFDTITDFVAAGSFADLKNKVKYYDKFNFAQLIRTTDIKNNFKGDDFIYIDENAFNFLWRVNLNTDAIILPNIGANIGEVYFITPHKLPHENNALGPNALLLRSSKENLFFLYCLCQSSIFQKTLSLIVGASGQPKFNKTDLKTQKIPVPPLGEQEKIAGILSVWDDGIEKLNELIKEKENQKKGLAQELLTAKTRLSGFSEPWQEVKLGDICDITTGKLDANAMVKDGKYKFFTCAKETYSINQYAFDTEALLISGNGANVGYIHYYNGKFNAYQRTYVLMNFSKNIFLIKHFLDKFLSNRIEKEKKAGNTPYIVLSTLSDMKMKLPSDIKEQQAIADILTKADEEIDLLKQKLEALKDEKKGLMEKLLTGEIRVKVN